MDIYRIAVRIALTNGMSPVLAIISRDLVGVHAKVGEIEKGFGRWALAIGGMGAIMTGGLILGGMAKIAERGSEVNHQLELMKLQGMQFAEIQESAVRAMQVSGSVLTSTYSDNLKHIRELRYAFGETPDALKYLEAVTKANMTLNAMKGGGTDQVWELVKSLEQKGLTAKPDEFLSYIDQMTKAVVASGGKVTPAQFFSAFKYGRTAMLGWDETFITQYLPRLIQSMSGGGGGGGSGTGGPGNALMSAFAKVVQGQMPKAAAMEFQRLGLAQVSHIKGSGQSLVGAVKGADIFLKNPYEWVQQVLVPAMMQKFGELPKGLTPDQIQNEVGKAFAKGGQHSQFKIIEEISKLFPVRTASQIIAEMTLQGRTILGAQSPFEKDARLQRDAFDQRMAYDELIKNDYSTMMTAFHAQWKSFNEVIGAPLTEPGGPVVAVLADITSLMHSVTAVAQAHPEAVRIVADALAALAASLIVGGLVALGIAIGGLVGVGAIVVALAAGLATFAALNWPAIKSAVANAISAISTEFNRIASMKSPGDALKAIADDLERGLKAWVTKMAELATWVTPSGLVKHGFDALKDYFAKPAAPNIPAPNVSAPPALPKVEKQSYLISPRIPIAPAPQQIAFDIGRPRTEMPVAYAPQGAPAASSREDGTQSKRRLMVIPPPSGQQTIQVATAINLDGRQIAEVVTKHQVRESAGPAQGAPYHDSTYSTTPVDFALA